MQDMVCTDTPKLVINIDLDEKSFVFPHGKHLTQLRLTAMSKGDVTVEGVYSFNASRAAPELLRLRREDMAEFSRKLVEAVYRAQAQHVVSETLRTTIFVIANGYIIQIGDSNESVEIFLSTSCIWRVCQGFLRAADQVAPIATH